MPSVHLTCPRCQAVAEADDSPGQPLACPGCGGPLRLPGAEEQGSLWYYARDRQKVGPVSRTELQELVALGRLRPADMLLQQGERRWVSAGSVPGLFAAAQPETVSYAPGPAPAPARLPDTVGSAAPTASPEQPSPPATVPGYEILDVLGRGGMGVVYKARHLQLKRLVALKMVLSGAQAGPEELARFRREAEAVARLQHPNIVQIYEVGEHDGVPYFALEYVEGGTLAQRLAGRPQAPRPAARLAERLARAIASAHEHGVIHRDLKPANILLEAPAGAAAAEASTWDRRRRQDTAAGTGPGSSAGGSASARSGEEAGLGNPKVTDFGLAKCLQEGAGQTATGSVLGTPSYMAPEQADGRNRDVGPATDVYALGAILYEALTGRPPFRGATVLDTLELVRTQDPVPPRQLQPGAPRDLETICLKCLEKAPGRRYPGARDLADDLGRYLAGLPIRARPTPPWERVLKWARRRPGVAALLAVILLVTAGSFAAVLSLMLQAEGRRQQAEGARDQAQVEFTAEQAALRQAEVARNDELFQSNRARALLARAGNNLYYTNVARALREWHVSAIRTAEELLDQCPYRLCHWEWYYLKRLCQGGVLTLPGGQQAVFTPDGRRLVADYLRLGQSAELVVWEGEPGSEEGYREVRRLTLPARNVYSVAVSADGKRLAAACGDNTYYVTRIERRPAPSAVLVWDADTGRQIFSRPRGDGDVLSVAFSPDGRHLAAGGVDGVVRLLDAATGAEVRALRGHAGAVFGVAFSPDGGRLAAVQSGAGVKVWDVATGQERFTCRDHAGGTFGVAFSPDGKWLASGGKDATVRLWDAATGAAGGHFAGHTGPVLSVAFSPDGARLAAASYDRTVRLWGVAPVRELFVFRGHRDRVTRVVFRPDGRYLASAGADRVVRLWSATSDPEVRRLEGHAAAVRAVAFSPDGRRLASGGGDGPVKVWDARTGQESFTLPGHAGGVTGVAFGPDGRLASVGRDGVARLWDLDRRREVRALDAHAGPLWGLALSGEGRRLATAGEDHTVRVWDTVGGRQLLTFRGHRNRVTAVAFSPDGRLLASASLVPGGPWWRRRGEVQLWDATTGAVVKSFLGHVGIVRGLAFGPGGDRLAVASGEDEFGARGEVRVWDVRAGQVRFTLRGHDSAVYGVTFSPDGRRLVSSGKGLWLWDAATGQQIVVLAEKVGGIHGLAFSADGRHLAGACADKTVRVWDALDGPAVRTLAGHRTPVDWVAFSPDGRHLASLSTDWVLKLWDASAAREVGGPRLFLGCHCAAFSPDGRRLAVTYRNPTGAAAGRYEVWLQDPHTDENILRIPAHAAPIWALAYGPGGARLASGGDDRLVKVWDTATGHALLDLGGHGDRVTAVAFSPDGRLLASGSADRTVRVWDTEDGRLLHTLGHGGKVTAVVFSPDGQWLAGAGRNGTVKVWGPDTGREVHSLGHASAVWGVAFRPDGRQLATATDAGLVCLWDVAAGRQTRMLRDHRGAVHTVAFSPDGLRLASGGADNVIKIRELTTWPR